MLERINWTTPFNSIRNKSLQWRCKRKLKNMNKWLEQTKQNSSERIRLIMVRFRYVAWMHNVHIVSISRPHGVIKPAIMREARAKWRERTRQTTTTTKQVSNRTTAAAVRKARVANDTLTRSFNELTSIYLQIFYNKWQLEKNHIELKYTYRVSQKLT